MPEPGADAGGSTRPRHHLLALLAIAAALVAMLWPLPLHNEIIGHPISDVADHFWGAWWWGGEILSGRLPLHSSITHLPKGSDLWYVDPVGAALSLPFRALGVAAAFNIALFLNLALTALAQYVVAWRWTRRAGPSAVAAILVACSPYMMGLVHSGLSEYSGLVAPVVFFGLLLETLHRERPTAGVSIRSSWPLYGILGALTVLACTLQAFYYGLFACLLGLCFVVGPRIRERLPRLGLMIGAGILLSAPLLYFAHGSVSGAAVNADSAPSWRQAILPATDLALFLLPGKHYFPDTPAMGNPGILHVHYVGWFALLFGLTGLMIHKRLRSHLGAVLLYMLCCLGPAAAWMGQLHHGKGFPLPLSLLYQLPFSPFAWIHHPYRLMAFLLPALGLGTALLLARLPRWAAPACALLILVESWFVSPAVWPLPHTEVSAPAVYTSLPEPGGVLDWPPDASSWNRSYEIWQVSHGRPIPYGVNVFLPVEIEQDSLGKALLQNLDDPFARARNRDVPGRLAPPGPPSDRPSLLGLTGLRYFVLHEPALSTRERNRSMETLSRWYGEPLMVSEGARVWRIPEGAVRHPDQRSDTAGVPPQQDSSEPRDQEVKHP